MPYGDRTGPMGSGPMTGRGMGFCNGYDVPGAVNGGRMMGGGFGRGFGRGMGRGMGIGMCRGFGFNRGYATVWGTPAPAADEKQFLEAEMDTLSRQLEAVKKRLEQMDGDKNKDK